MEVWLNGKFVDRDQATVSIFDAGFQHAVGLFETMLARNSHVFRPKAHLRRLEESARILLLSESLHIEPLQEAVQHTIDRNGFDAARIRLTLTGGDLNLLQSTGAGRNEPTLLIVAQPPTEYPPAFFEQGVRVTVADGRDNPFHPMAGHKTLNYWPRILALQQAGARGAAEAIWFSVTNHLTCGSVSNAFLVKDSRLRTPIARGEEEPGAIPSAVLPGVTRAAVCALGDAEGIQVARELLTIENVLAADEVFLTNSSWGILPVTAVEGETIGDGQVGPITRRLREAWLALIDEETAPAT